MRVITSVTGIPSNALDSKVAELESRGFQGISTQENRFDPFLPLAVAIEV